jgi:hypothetical protein
MSNKEPTHIAYVVSGDGDKKAWTRIGAAWGNRDGKGFNIVLDAVPVSGRLTLRLAKDAEGGAQ